MLSALLCSSFQPLCIRGLHSSGSFEVGMVVDASGGFVFAPDSQEGLCKEEDLLMFSCTMKRTFAVK